MWSNRRLPWWSWLVLAATLALIGFGVAAALDQEAPKPPAATAPPGLAGPTGAIGNAARVGAPLGLLGPTGTKIVTVTVTQRYAIKTTTIRERSNGHGGWVAIP